MDNEDKGALLTLTVEIVAAHVSNNRLGANDLPTLIANVHGALAALRSSDRAVTERGEPMVSVRASLKPDYLVCLEDGKRMTMLKRHLRTDHQMTPDEYRKKWGLNSNYPMIAPNYAEKRRSIAKSTGLGTKRRKKWQGQIADE